MKQHKNRKEDITFVTSIQQVEFVFRTLFKDYNEKTLTDGILLWLAKMKDNAVLKTFLSFPELFEDYDIEDFLKTQVDIPDLTNKQNIRVVGLAACLLYFITTCWDLFGKKIHEQHVFRLPSLSEMPQEEIDIIQDVLINVSQEEFQTEFSASVMSIIGEKYHEKFLEKLEPFDYGSINIQQAKLFENDSILKEHMQFMLWSGLMRCFIDAVYFYFNKGNIILFHDKL